jgi:hypothetical protein
MALADDLAALVNLETLSYSRIERRFSGGYNAAVPRRFAFSCLSLLPNRL